MKALFMTGEKLEEYTSKEVVSLEGDVLEITAKKLKYKLSSAIRVIKCVSSEGDPNNIVGKALTLENIKELNAEYYPGSLIVGEEAYETEEGFLGSPLEVQPTTEAAPAPTPKTEAAHSPNPAQASPPKPSPPPKPIKDEPPAPTHQKPAPEEKSGETGDKTDVELLTEFLLKKL